MFVVAVHVEVSKVVRKRDREKERKRENKVGSIFQND